MAAPYAPFMDPRTAHPPGLSPLDPGAWVAHDPDYAVQMAARDRLIAGDPDGVIAALPEAAAILGEFRETLLAHLAARPGWRIGAGEALRPDGARVDPALPALRLAGALCQEDFLLMAGGAPEYRLVAGVLCFPSRWSLAEKLGRPMTGIHAPVPRYDAPLAARVNRVFAMLRAGQPLIRFNWLVHATDRLDLPLREGRGRPPVAPGAALWLRTERQTLLRLPRTGAVVFGVKTTLTPLGDLDAAQRAGLRAALAQWDAAEIDYRGGGALHEAALAALA